MSGLASSGMVEGTSRCLPLTGVDPLYWIAGSRMRRTKGFKRASEVHSCSPCCGSLLPLPRAAPNLPASLAIVHLCMTFTRETTSLATHGTPRHHRYIFEEKEGRDPNAPKDKDGTAKKKKSVIARLQVGQLSVAQRDVCDGCCAQRGNTDANLTTTKCADRCTTFLLCVPATRGAHRQAPSWLACLSNHCSGLPKDDDTQPSPAFFGSTQIQEAAFAVLPPRPLGAGPPLHAQAAEPAEGHLRQPQRGVRVGAQEGEQDQQEEVLPVSSCPCALQGGMAEVLPVSGCGCGARVDVRCSGYAQHEETV